MAIQKMRFLFVLLLLVGQFAPSLEYCHKRKKLQMKPRPMKGFAPEKMRGRWFTIARHVPCGFQGFREFTDDIRDADFDMKERKFIIRKTYRVNGKCQMLMDTRAERDERPGLILTQDALGDLYTGDRIAVYTDFNNFLIQWGCLKYSMQDPNICHDVTMAIMSRTPTFRQSTLKIIDILLQKTFDIQFSELEMIKHDNPCYKVERKKHKKYHKFLY